MSEARHFIFGVLIDAEDY